MSRREGEQGEGTVTSTVNGGLTRVTVVAPTRRMHLAIPADVPISDLVPTLLQYIGVPAAEDGTVRPWILTRLGGMALDPNRTPTVRFCCVAQRRFGSPAIW